MPKHRGKYRLLKYPVSMYKHWALNNWHFFTKPALKRKYVEVSGKVVTWLNQKR